MTRQLIVEELNFKLVIFFVFFPAISVFLEVYSNLKFLVIMLYLYVRNCLIILYLSYVLRAYVAFREQILWKIIELTHLPSFLKSI